MRGVAFFGESVPKQYALCEIPLDRTIKNPALHAIFRKKPVVAEEPSRDQCCRDFKEGLRALSSKQFVNVPVRIDGEVIGVIGVDRFGESTPIETSYIEFLAAFADFAASAIGNARLYDQARELSLIDDLTGLYNVRFFREQLARALAQANRSHQPIALALFDIDNLKAVNDLFGHQLGDCLLKQVGEAIKSALRTSDVVARYGGDEFVVLFYGADIETACKAAKRVTESIEALSPIGKGVKADRACYEAKRAGGNRISTADAGSQHS